MNEKGGNVPLLKDWTLLPHICSVQGEVYGHPVYDEGKKITTSEIMELHSGVILTISGSRYRLDNAVDSNSQWRDLHLVLRVKNRPIS